MTIFRSLFVVTGVLFLLMGCQSSTQPDSSVVLVVPTPLADFGSPTPPLGDGEVLPPVVTVDGKDGEEVRPTWTPLPTGTQQAACGQPAGWATYAVQAGDTLSAIAEWSGSTLTELVEVNCIENPTRIEIAQLLYVPREILPTATPEATSTSLPTETPTATQTPEPRTEIDFFYIDEVVADIAQNDEITLRWQVTGPGEFVLSWDHSLLLDPVILKDGEQGEYTLKVQLPDSSGMVLFNLIVIDQGNEQIGQIIELDLP